MACTNPERGQEDHAKKLIELEKEILEVIPIKGILNSATRFYQPVGSNRLYALNSTSGNLFYLKPELDSLKLVLKTALEAINYYTVDSEFGNYVMVSGDTVHVLDETGDDIYRYPLNKLSKGGFSTVLDQHFAPVVHNNKLYIHHFPNVPESYKSRVFYSQPVEMVIDMKSDSLSLVRQSYPTNYKEYCYGYVYNPHRRALDSNRHAFTYPYNDSVFVVNIKSDSKNSYDFGPADSQSLSKIPINQAQSVSDQTFDSLYLNNPIYRFPKYAPLAGYNIRTMVMPRDSIYDISAVKYVIYDNEFNYLGETKAIKDGPGQLLDSKDGLRSVKIKNDSLFIYSLSW